MRINCPNCGAPFKGTSCEYCGTRLEDIFAVEAGEPVMLSWTYNGKTITVKMRPTSFRLDTYCPFDSLYANDIMVGTIAHPPQSEVTLTGMLEPFEWQDKEGVFLLTEGDIRNDRA